MTQSVMSLEECCTDFGQRFSKHKTHMPQRQQLAKFVGATQGTVATWLRGATVPQGENKYKLIIFFVTLGYRVREFEQMRSEYKQVSKLLGYGLTTPKEIGDAFSFVGKASHVFEVLNKNRTLRDEGQTTLKQFLAANNTLLQEVEKEYTTLFHEAELLLSAPPELPPPTIQTVAPPSANRSHAKSVLAESAGQQVAALLPLLRWLESDDCSDELRTKFRASAGNGIVFKANNALTRLCGERARKQTGETK